VNRRDLLTQLLPAAAAALVLPRAVVARRAKPDVAITPLANSLTLISGLGGNVTLLHAPNGVLMVDGGSPEHTPALLKSVRELTHTKRVEILFNTHWHWDQTGANAALGETGTRIIAHENTRLWLATEVDSKWEQRVYKRLPEKARPNDTFYTTGALDFGGEHIEYGHLPYAHTDGDIYVFFRNANVLVAGDAVAADAWPVIDYCTGGWIGGMANAAKALLDLANAETRIVAGRGRVQSRADVQELHQVLVTMKERLAKLLAKGMSAQDMIAATPARDFEAKWGDPSLFIANAWPGLVYRARELGVSIV
jgi:glyoxylase-like metal-dependent hydrolase (beta-lactamase superfamily II)